MIKVQCPSCTAPYDLDERRLPQSGLKMRCPKCGASFRVHPSGETGPAEGGAPRDEAPTPARPSKRTMVGVAPPGAVPAPGAAPRQGAPVKPAPVKPPAPAAPTKPGAPAAKPTPPTQAFVPRPPPPAPKLSDDPDLPAAKPVKPVSPFAPKPVRAAPAPAAPQDDEIADLPAPKPAAARGPIAPAFQPSKPAARGPIAPAFDPSDGGVDLPAPKKQPIAPAFPGAKPAAAKTTQPEESFADLELDLPGLKQDARDHSDFDVDLPAPKSGDGGIDIDLPAPKRTAPKPVASPEPSAAPRRPAPLADDFGEVDLPAAKGSIDLPAARRPTQGGFELDELDLPAPKELSDLPMPKATGGGGFDDLDLPMPKGAADLPVPKPSGGGGGFDDLDLPIPKAGQDLPAPKTGGGGGGFDDLDLPIPKSAQNLPAPKRSSESDFGELDLPISKSGANLPARSSAPPSEVSFDDLELPEPGPRASVRAPAPRPPLPDDTGAELDLPPAAPERVPRTPDGRAGAGGVGFGEIDFGDDGDDMEFADLPEERPSLTGAREAAQSRGAIGVADTAEADAPRGAVVDRIVRPQEPRARRRGGVRAVTVVLVLLVLAGLAGVGAGMFTPYGYFGMYAIEQLLPEAGDEATARSTIDSAEQIAASDAYVDVRASISELGAARRKMGLNRRLLARSLVHESLYRVRFGEDAASEARSVAILQRLESRGGEAPGMALARAAHALAQGDAAGAQRHLTAARVESPQDPYVDLVAGEAALLAGEHDRAAEAFEQAAQKGGGARAQWGLARAKLGAGDAEAASSAIDAVLAASPRHAEALAAKGELLVARGELDGALELAQQAAGITPIEGETLRPSHRAKARAFALIGRIQEMRGNRSAARQAYDDALAADPHHVPALIGAGRVLLADGRNRDALTRFEAALGSMAGAAGTEASGRSLEHEAKLGAARAMIHVDRVQDAKQTLTELVAALPEDAEVALWLGKAEQALGEHAAAEQQFRESVRLAPDRFDGYLALAQLFFETERPADAAAVLNEARRQVEETAHVLRLLGESELARNDHEAAIAQFNRALALDSNETAALFGLGVAQRRAGRLEQAQEAFGRVAERDAGWPGLALERGMVFEALGQSDRAVAMFRRALEESPEDPDLMLRLGAAYVAAGQIEEADETLQKVMEARPNSAEAEHFMGRVLLARGEPGEALHHFSRATSLDPNRGEYWLYIGWAALDQGDLSRALESVAKAIELDPSLGDAHWLRGRIRVRTGAVRDAETDLKRALELKPSRHEAWADLGDAYDQLRRVSDAVRAYEEAVERVPTNGAWWYRLGRLRMDSGNASGSRAALERATTLGDALEDRPAWLPDAHRVLGDAARLTGARAQAIEHYRKYLEIAPQNAIDRDDVQRNLDELTR